MKNLVYLLFFLVSLSFTTNAYACSRITIDTPHGVCTIRSLDWQTKLGGIAVVHPKGLERKTRSIENSQYQNHAHWTTKYTTLAIEEPNLFGYANSEAINSEGLSVSVLYLGDSTPFIKDHIDTNKPAVNFKDLPSFIVENFRSVEEFLHAYKNGKFIEAWKDGIDGYQHGLHYSVQDKYGKIALIQLQKGGKTKIHEGTIKTDLRVMTNSPLQEEHRKYIANFNLNSKTANSKIPNSPSSQDRMVQGLYNTTHIKFDNSNTWKQIEKILQNSFDLGNLVPQGSIDPKTGECNPTWTIYLYNHTTGVFKFRNIETSKEIYINFKDIQNYTKPMQANLVEQSNKGLQNAIFTPYIEHK